MWAGREEPADCFKHCKMDDEFESEELSFKNYEDLMMHSSITSNFIWKLRVFDFLFHIKNVI